MTTVAYTATKGLTLLGDEAGVWLADTTGGLAQGVELVVGRNMADLSAWTPLNSGTTLSLVGGRLRVEYASGPSQARAYQILSTVVGEAYRLHLNFFSGTSSSGSVVVSTSVSSSTSLAGDTGVSADKAVILQFTATTTTTYLLLVTDDLTPGEYTEFDNASVRLISVDRSTNAKGIHVYGGLTRAPVAPGAELMGYSGFGLGPELVNVGNMVDLSAWTPLNSGTTLSLVGGRLRVEYASGPSQARAYQILPTVIGETYRLHLNFFSGTSSSGSVVVSTTVSTTGQLAGDIGVTTSTTVTFRFTATTTTTYLLLVTDDFTPGEHTEFDNATVKRLNVLEQPYNADFDFSTGDFGMGLWLKETGAALSVQNPMQIGQSSAYSINIIRESSSGSRRLGFHVSGSAGTTGDVYTQVAPNTGVWVQAFLVRRGGVFEFYVNGDLTLVNATNVGGLTPLITDVLRIGYGSRTLTEVEMAASISRVLGYAPTASQIRGYYQSERGLFKSYAAYTQAGESYSLEFDSVSVLTRVPATQGLARLAIDGTREYLAQRDEVLWDVTTGIVDRSEYDSTRRFLESTARGAPFTFDPYGSIATPDDPRQVTLESGTHAEQTTGPRLLNTSFRVREV